MDVPSPKRCNELDGRTWLRYSVSVWDDIRKTPEELKNGHPASFPSMLVRRLIQAFLAEGEQVVLDPFVGTGSTVVAASEEGKRGIGLDISPEYIACATRRVASLRSLWDAQSGRLEPILKVADARKLLEHVAPGSLDLCITSPPYWNILNQKRTADYKPLRNYGNQDGDLGTIADYQDFLDELAVVFRQVFAALKLKRYCVVVVMDLRKKDRFFPLHSDLARRMQEIGFVYDDLIVWDRRAEYNNLRPLGYPSVFRVNKVHEFVLIFRKGSDE